MGTLGPKYLMYWYLDPLGSNTRTPQIDKFYPMGGDELGSGSCVGGCRHFAVILRTLVWGDSCLCWPIDCTSLSDVCPQMARMKTEAHNRIPPHDASHLLDCRKIGPHGSCHSAAEAPYTPAFPPGGSLLWCLGVPLSRTPPCTERAPEQELPTYRSQRVHVPKIWALWSQVLYL